MTTLYKLPITVRTLGIALLLASGVIGGLFTLEGALGERDAAACWSWKGCGETVPYCTLKASTDSILQGQSTTLTWSTGGGVDSVEFIGFPDASYPANGTLTVVPTDSHTYRIVAKSSARNSTAVCQVTVSVGEACLPGTCSMRVTPTTIVAGEEATLTWETTNVESGSINQGVGDVPQSGSVKLKPNETTTYTGTFLDTSGATLSCTATLTVTPPSVPDPTCSMGALPSEIKRGEQATLYWESSSVESASVDQGIGTISTSGTRLVSPATTTTYTGTFIGKNGMTKVCSATILVRDPEPPVPACSLTASPESIVRGSSSTLTWSATDVTGGGTLTSVGAIGISGSASVMPTDTTTYVASFTGKNGAPISCERTVTVTVPTPPTPVCSISVNPSSVTKGTSALLSWTSTHATSGSISAGVGTVSPNGTATVTPESTTTYTGTFVGEGGSATCSATLSVVPPSEEPLPTCAMSVTPASVASGGSATLAWSSTNATGASISQGIGTVATSGATTVSTTEPKTYVGTFTRGSQSVTCSATLSVVSDNGGGGGGGPCLNCGTKKTVRKVEEKKPSPTIVLAKKVTTGLSSITLDQVPYTGFTAGPFTTLFFWIGVLAVSALVAYLITLFTPVTRLRRVLAHMSHEGTHMSRNVDQLKFSPTEISPVQSRDENHSYYSYTEMQTVETNAVETIAQADNILLSPEANRMLQSQMERSEEGATFLRRVLDRAKATYSREDGWILLSKDRVNELLGIPPMERREEPKHALPHNSSLHDVTFKNVRSLAANRTPLRTPQQTPAHTETQHQIVPSTVARDQQNGEGQQTTRPQLSGQEHMPIDPSQMLAHALVLGQENQAYAFVRERVQEQTLQRSIVVTLEAFDNVYKHRLEGNHNPDTELVRLTESWNTTDFEKILGYLVECVDHSYENSMVGVKVGLVKVFSYLASKSR